MEPAQAADESRVLIIYTGGTIGMLVGHQGYVPEPHFLTETLRSQNRFHDPQHDSLFSNSASVQGFRNWSSVSGKNSPQHSSGGATPVKPQRSLLVRSSRPIVSPNSDQGIQSTCVQVSENVYQARLPSLVTPYSAVPGGTGRKAIRYVILEWNPLLDSSNLEIQDWIRIATEIEMNYNFDAFVVLHGTDTMAYTASALSFMLEDLGKTIIITGAQIPMSQLRNDAVDNLMGALTIAGHYIIPECCLYFNHTLYRGNRVSKMSSYDLNAFESPNFPPLVKVGIDIVVNWNDVLRQTSLNRFHAHKQMCAHVVSLRLFPGISGATMKAFFIPPVRGVVLETFGAGNAPQRADITEALKEACDRGVVIVAITQCMKGNVSDAYETGRALLQAGVVAGGDMTPECALTKLSYLLSKPVLSIAQVRELMTSPLRGELSRAFISAPSQPGLPEKNFDAIQGLLSEFVRLVPPPSGATNQASHPSPTETLDPPARKMAAPWTSTVSEIAKTEAALLPFLIHLSAARNDLAGLKFCLEAGSRPDLGGGNNLSIPGGLINCLDPSTNQTPLHCASLNGSQECVNLLLRSGALVHLRDSLGHTPLYYAARQGHESTVETLIQAGATLGGFDEPFAALGIRDAHTSGGETSLRIWSKAGAKITE